MDGALVLSHRYNSINTPCVPSRISITIIFTFISDQTETSQNDIKAFYAEAVGIIVASSSQKSGLGF